MASQHKQAAPSGPLADVRVIDLSAVLMSPYATQIFGDHGVDVIKIESPVRATRHDGSAPDAIPAWVRCSCT
jgi:crotonobetainyl-CoA:carnitine CoA-transferase CaiB-like acyl-CoA transferase